MTIGNLLKDIRRKPSRHGQILIGYLPTSHLESFSSNASQCRALANLFYKCIAKILEPLQIAGVEGIHMQSGNGACHRTHPIFAIFVGDYPEQLLVTCCKNFQCPKCVVNRHNLGNNKISPPWDLIAILNALNTINDGPTAYAKACISAGIKPVYEPF
jgi:Plavaka transposase